MFKVICYLSLVVVIGIATTDVKFIIFRVDVEVIVVDNQPDFPFISGLDFAF